MADDMIDVKEWFDNHPDYLLIIASDHGHDERGLMFLLFYYILQS